MSWSPGNTRWDTCKCTNMLGILFEVDTVYTMMYRPPNESIVVILQYYLTNHNLRFWFRMREGLTPRLSCTSSPKKPDRARTKNAKVYTQLGSRGVQLWG
jgi:hypothetical protein